MKYKKIKDRLYKILDSWVGAVIFIFVGFLITYFLLNSNTILYILILIGVPILYLTKKQDWLPYIYGGTLFAFLAHYMLGVIFSTSFPVVAVVSSSMQHDNVQITHYDWLEKNMGYNKTYIDSWPIKNGFSIGDMPIVKGSDDYKVGDVIVYDAGQSAPIIHRIIKINADGTYQTKGDNNPGQLQYESSVKKSQIQGKVIFVVPKLGWFKVIISKIVGV
jgi:hypothetical protein